jgi:hypothetical protein
MLWRMLRALWADFPGKTRASNARAITLLVAFAMVASAAAQRAYPRPPGAATPAATPAPAAATPAAANDAAATATTTSDASASGSSQPAAVSSASAASSPDQTPAPVAPPPASAAKTKGKPKKEVYSGPTEIVTLPASPMMDESGKPALDPDGKPLFNPPQKQLRDKKGHPIFDEKGKPVFETAADKGYDERGKKLKVEKVKPPKLVPVHVNRGTFSVDGVVGKAALNYDIPDLKYVYMYAPGIGVAIVSSTAFPGASEQKNAFNGTTLVINVGEHKLELASDGPLLGKKPESAFVKIDRDYTLPSRFPVFGYGKLRVAPYSWPGAKPNVQLANTIAPPPLPKNLQPTLAIPTCPKGQTRQSPPPPQKGQPQAVMPCLTQAQLQALQSGNPNGAQDKMNYGR